MALEVAIKKYYPDFSLDVNFYTEKGILGVLGASGCGKSMTLKCIAGIETPDEGKIILNGRVLFDSEKKINLSPQKRNIGYLFQNYALFPHMNVEENIAVLTNNSSIPLPLMTQQLLSLPKQKPFLGHLLALLNK